MTSTTPEEINEVLKDERGLRMSCSRWAFSTEEVFFSGDNLVSLTIRTGVDPVLARIILQELLRRYANRTPELPF